MTVDELLTPFTPPVRDIALRLRALVRDVWPDGIEVVDPPDKLIAYCIGPRMADVVCIIRPYTRHVNLGFFDGTRLPDPDGLLEGTGKRHRHIKVREPEDADNPALHTLLEAAVKAKSHSE